MRTLLLSCALLFSLASSAQTTFPVNGTVEKGQSAYLFENAVIHVNATSTVEGSLLVQKGRIVAIGTEFPNMSGAVKVDLQGMHVYPSFIESYSSFGVPKVESGERKPGPQSESNRKGAFGWNQAMKPEINAFDVYTYDEKAAANYLKAGFGALFTHQEDGIARGTGAVVTLNPNDNLAFLQPTAAKVFSFQKGTSRQDYPSSLMGCIALLRQTAYDAAWYDANGNKLETNLSLAAWNANAKLPQIFVTRDKLDVLRADLIGDEFNVQYVFKGNGDEYMRIEELTQTEGKFIVPVNFPEAYDVSDPYLARMISLTELKHWEMAPANLAMMEAAGIEFAITADGLKSPSKLLANVRKAVQYGLSEEMALKALTEIPAEILGVSKKVGTLDVGKEANFIVTDGFLFDPKTKIIENWVQGTVTVVKDRTLTELDGLYALNFEQESVTLKVMKEDEAYKASFEVIRDGKEGADTTKVKVKLSQEGEMVNFSFGPVDSLYKGVYMFTGNAFTNSRIWEGQGQAPSGKWFNWAAVRSEDLPKEEKVEKRDSLQVEGAVFYPFIAFGRTEKATQKNVLITNATLWTCEEEGVIESGQMLVIDGKIAAVGAKIDLAGLFGKVVPEYEVIDAKGKHVTPGIIDEHSHIAISRGVNEGSQASSAEVSIASVVNSEDINIYRQLSGGVTCSQLLHGSANPIGGQSAIIKLRWGLTPEEMKVENGTPFIKFALGENVKQSNWGDYYRERFPQSRMGVEQVFYDHFIRAREYGEAWDIYNNATANLSRKQIRKGETPLTPRVDLEMATLLQILESERFVSCHSYRQDEINMLMHVADSMGFTLNTFTHILEGYKVADKMKAHGAGGSTFSDWWAYKFEVKDAIPFNGALMYEQGITTAYNSDDAEMARRLNQEAAKAVKYGGVPEEEALKFVTLNPAKLLHLDDRMGSLLQGKDADFVIWTDHPLSIYAKAEQTYIDGKCYYSMEKDVAARAEVQTERARILQLMLDSKGGAKRKPSEKLPMHYHCDSETDENR
jgi:imidazolonepropionase-like amidohydrolase